MPVVYAPACMLCGSMYLNGSSTICSRCLHENGGSHNRRTRRPRFRCDCGAWAVAVILVQVGCPEDSLSEQRLPLCERCLEIEMHTQAMIHRRNRGKFNTG